MRAVTVVLVVSDDVAPDMVLDYVDTEAAEIVSAAVTGSRAAAEADLLRCVVMVGSPVDGVTLTGPFDTVSDASEWAEVEVPNETWWVVEVEKPVDSEAQTRALIAAAKPLVEPPDWCDECGAAVTRAGEPIMHRSGCSER